MESVPFANHGMTPRSTRPRAFPRPEPWFLHWSLGTSQNGAFEFPMLEILDNLISNALKFSTAGTVVHVVVASEPVPHVTIRDRGQGLTEEDRRRLFEPFARLSARPTAGERSVGLGLHIVKHMADAMGARIRVDSEPGRGAAFRVEFPAGPEAPA